MLGETGSHVYTSSVRKAILLSLLLSAVAYALSRPSLAECFSALSLLLLSIREFGWRKQTPARVFLASVDPDSPERLKVLYGEAWFRPLSWLYDSGGGSGFVTGPDKPLDPSEPAYGSESHSDRGQNQFKVKNSSAEKSGSKSPGHG